MNRRQRKKKDAKGLTLIFSCEMVCKQETYANLERMIQAQLNKGNVIVLPPYLRLEGIAGGSRVKRIKIMKERNATINTKRACGAYKLVGTRKGNKKRRRSVYGLGLLPKGTLQGKRIYRRRDSNRL